MNDIARESLLYDFYGGLLTSKKRRVMELYHEQNLSLSEIAEETGVTRAAVHDALKSAERKLEEYEEKLGMVARLEKEEQILRSIRERLRFLQKGSGARKAQAVEEIHRMLTELERI